MSVHNHNEVNDTKVCRKEKSEPGSLIYIIEKISAVALCAFAAYTSWKLFVPYFFVGVCIGIYSHTQQQKSSENGEGFSSCTNGLLEQLTGVKLLPSVYLVTNLAITICHVEHHPSVFVPVAGIYFGACAGKAALYYGDLAYKKITLYFSPQVSYY